MLYAMEAESNFIEVHHEIVGFGASPGCSCRACRDKWSKATPDERAAADVSLQNYLDRACSRTEKAPDQHVQATNTPQPDALNE
jgi:hypothetical protein